LPATATRREELGADEVAKEQVRLDFKCAMVALALFARRTERSRPRVRVRPSISRPASRRRDESEQ